MVYQNFPLSKFSHVRYLYLYLYLNTSKSTCILLKYFSQNNAMYLYLYFNKCQSTCTLLKYFHMYFTPCLPCTLTIFISTYFTTVILIYSKDLQKVLHYAFHTEHTCASVLLSFLSVDMFIKVMEPAVPLSEFTNISTCTINH